MKTLSNYITVDSKIQFGKPVFKGTRTPMQSLFWHLEKGISLNAFLEDFPGVSRQQAEAVIEWSANILNHLKAFWMKLLLDENLPVKLSGNSSIL